MPGFYDIIHSVFYRPGLFNVYRYRVQRQIINGEPNSVESESIAKPLKGGNDETEKAQDYSLALRKMLVSIEAIPKLILNLVVPGTFDQSSCEGSENR